MSRSRNVFVALALVFLSLGRLHAQTFTPLGDLPGVNFGSLANGISADGAVVVGVSNTDVNGANFAAFRWEDGVMVNLGDHLMRGSIAHGVSADGTHIVGISETQTLNRQAAVRWVNNTLELLEIPGGAFAFARPEAVSADGAVIVGRHQDGPLSAIKWVNGAPSLLPTFSGHQTSFAWDVSGDGSVIVGEGQFAFGTPHAVLWDFGGGTVVDIHPAGWARSSAQAVSADGNVIVGWVENGTAPEPFDRRPFRWENGELTVLETPGYAYATDVSSDGSVIVGFDATFLRPAMWTSEEGWRDLIAVLIDMNVDLHGFTSFSSLPVISDNGLAIAGSGVNADGSGEGYLILLGGPETDLVVNDNRDLDDASATDRVCDADTDETGNQCTLRAAIEEANRRGGGTITFNIPVSGVPSIQIGMEGLPPLESVITLDATTQPGGWVELVGPGVESTTDITGIEIEFGGGGSIVRGFVIHGFRRSGIALATDSDGSVIEGNRIGTDVTGTIARGNGKGTLTLPYGTFQFSPESGGINWPGLLIASSNNRIEGNTIAGNYAPSFFGFGNSGVDVLVIQGADNNMLIDNRIGVGVDNEPLALPQPSGFQDVYVGLWILGAQNTRVGESGEIGGSFSCIQSGCNTIQGHALELRIGTNEAAYPVPTSGTLILGNVIGKRLPSRGMQTGSAILTHRSMAPRIANNYIYGYSRGVSLDATVEADITGNHISSEEPQIMAGVERESSAALRTGLFFSGSTTVRLNQIFSPWTAIVANPGDVITNNTLGGSVADVSVYTDAEAIAPSARISRNTHSANSSFMESVFLGGVEYQGGVLAPRSVRAERRNDWLDLDGYQNAPVIGFVKREGNGVTVGGTLRSSALAASYLIEAFSCDGEVGCTLSYTGETEIVASLPYTGFRFTLPEIPGNVEYLAFTATRMDNQATSEMVGGPRIVSSNSFSETPLVVEPGNRVETQGMTLTVTHVPSNRGMVSRGDEATVFVARYDALPDTSVFADTSATSPSGTQTRPSAVAERTWFLGDIGLGEQTRGPEDSATFDLCFDASEVVVTDALDSVVIVQRLGGAGVEWWPLATDLSEIDGIVHLCARGRSTLGEFGFGGDGSAFPVSNEPETGDSGGRPPVFALDAPHPNPSDGAVTLRYEVPEAGGVRVSVYDLLGREAALLVDAEKEAGSHAVEFNTRALSSGVYVVRAVAGGVALSRQMTVLR